jgi:hypothetical protein
MRTLKTNTGARCFVHPGRPAEYAACIPCAPGGELNPCAEYARPDNGQRVFDAYKSKCGPNVKRFAERMDGKTN